MSVAAPRTPLRRLAAARNVPPVAVLVGGILLVALFAAITAAQIRAVVLDEAVYKLAAARYADGLPGELINDPVSRGVARLYSLVITPFFALLDGDVAVRAARIFNAFLFAAAAAPVYLLSRLVTESKWRSVAAGLLSIAVPWLTLSTILFSEALAYLLFASALLAMAHALRASTWKLDAAVLVLLVSLVLCRVQFVVLLPMWFAVCVLHDWRAGTLRTAWRRRPVLSGVVAVGLLLVVGLALTDRLQPAFYDFGGPYAAISERVAVNGNFGLALLYEVGMISLGVGLLPAVLAVGWLRRAFTGRAGNDGRRLALLFVAMLGALFAATLWAQGGWLGLNSEERYFIYAVPVLWVCAMAGLERAAVTAGGLLAGTLAFAALFLVLPIPVALSGEQFFLGPVAEIMRWGLPAWSGSLSEAVGLPGALTTQDVLGFAALVVAVLGALLWRLRSHRWAVLVPAVAVQLFITAYAFAGVHGQLDGVGGATEGAPLAEAGWVDRAEPGGQRVLLADNTADDRGSYLRNTMFFNDDPEALIGIEGFAVPDPPYPVNLIGREELRVGSDLQFTSSGPSGLVVQSVSSPIWQLVGERLGASPDGRFELIRPAGGARWLAAGLDADGHVPSRLSAVGAEGGHRVEITIAPPVEGAASELELELGGERRRYRSASGEGTLRYDLCSESGAVAGMVRPVTDVPLPDGRASLGRVVSVRMEPCG